MGVRSTNPTQSFIDDFFRSGTDAVKESLPLINSPITATGGDSTLTITGYKVHIFTTTGPATLNVSSGGGEVEYLVVAGCRGRWCVCHSTWNAWSCWSKFIYHSQLSSEK